MKQWLKCFALTAICALAFPYRSPAPVIFTPGEGWRYEAVGSDTSWQKTRAMDELDVAQKAFDKQDYSLAEKAAERVVTTWPLSDYAPHAEYLLARCAEKEGDDEAAFKAYQKLLRKYPKAANYEEILRRQFDICNRFLAGERFRLWGYIPTFSSMPKTVLLLQDLVNNGPFSDVAPEAQLNIGRAHEKETRFLNDNEPLIEAAKAYSVAADRYHDRPKVASEALFREGLAYQKQAQKAEYDQSTAEQAIDTFKEFEALYPDDRRVTQTEGLISDIKTEQSRGSFEVARFYERSHHWKSALIYYNECVGKDPKSIYAAKALQRITALKRLTDNSDK